MESPTVLLRSISIPVEVARTKAEIDKGLSGRPFLRSDSGMLFMFNHAAILQFWMPNMHFPIDIIWIGSNMKVVDITHNALPLPKLFFRKPKPIWYRPSVPAQYVLEVNAGFAEQHGFQIGDIAEFISL